MFEVILSQAKFDQLILRLAQEAHIPPDASVSVPKKAVQLWRLILSNGTDLVSTLDGTVTLTEAAVREAVGLIDGGRNPRVEQQRLIRALGLDGFVVEWNTSRSDAPLLRTALPEEVDLPNADDEVHLLLKYFEFKVSLGHLDQAIEAHTRGDWAAANSQIRTFTESLFEQIAHYIDPEKAAAAGSSENRRAWLAENGFLSKVRNEWTNDGKNFVNGLFKMLHTEGSHPGLSDEDRSTFRLHITIITARTFLRRLKNKE